jgi:hypothetical protein
MDATIYVSLDTVERQLVIHGPLELLSLLIRSVRDIPPTSLMEDLTEGSSHELNKAPACVR